MSSPQVPDYTLAQPTRYHRRPRMAGRVCVVTGATGGIGSATVLRLAEEGAEGIVIVDLDQQKCDAFAKNLSAGALQVPAASLLAMAADVADDKQVAAVFDAALKKFGHVDVAVVNAGKGSQVTPLLEESQATMEEMLKINTVGAWLTAKHAARVMLETKGDGFDPLNTPTIIINSSVAALYGAPGCSPYAASKWAARGIGLSLAQELGPLGIRVNNIHPGGTLTPLFHVCFNDEIAKAISDMTAMKRLADPIEIANAILFLASSESSYVSGTTLGVHAAQVP